MTEKIKKYRGIIFLFLIILLGLYLRLLFIDKPGGLWQDEIEVYTSASMSFPIEILESIRNSGVHPPLYYFLLHFWMTIFGNEDLTLRLFSVLTGILSIITGYFIGCQLKSKELGFIIALFIAVNSLFIFYSQEVRFYSIFIFFLSLSILFILKVQNDPNPWNYLGLGISNVLCMYTSSLGPLFVIIELFIYFVYLLKYKTNQLKAFIATAIITLIAFIPYINEIIRQYNIATNGFISIFGWARFTPLAIVYVIQDWFTPLVINIFGYAPDKYYIELFSKSELLIIAFIPLFLPLIICFIGLIKAVSSRNTNCILLFLIAISFFSVEILLTLAGKLALISRYTLPSALLFIIIAAYGINEFKTNTVKRLLIVNYAIICLFILMFTEFSSAKIARDEGLKYVADRLYSYNLSSNDLILMPYGGRYIKKYDKTGTFRVVDEFDMLDTYYFPNKTKLRHIFDEDIINKLNYQNAYELLYPYTTAAEIGKPLEYYFDSRVFKNLKSGNRLFLIVTRSLCMPSPRELIDLKNNRKNYENKSLEILLASKHYYDLIKLGFKKLTYLDSSSTGLWDIYVFEKTYLNEPGNKKTGIITNNYCQGIKIFEK